MVKLFLSLKLISLFSGKQWIKQMVVSAALLPLNVCAMAFTINFIAIYYHASRAIPFGTMVSKAPAFMTSVLSSLVIAISSCFI